MLRNLLNISSFVFPILFLYLLIRFSLIKKIKFNFKKDILRVTFVAYISSLIFIVWITGSNFSEHLIYNIIPFRTIIKYINSDLIAIAIKNIAGNIILTMPFGFFACFKMGLFPKLNIFLYSLLIPFTIEFVQLLLFIQGFSSRSIDIDDIILNSIGILIGYFFTNLFISRNHEKQEYTI